VEDGLKFNRPICIAVGELEGFMVDDGQAMYKYLSEHGINVSFYLALEENHASIVQKVISRALR
jgi:hypothetical protein